MSQAFGHLLHRLELAPHGAGAPCVKESPGPLRTHGVPELLEQLAEKVSPDALEAVLKELIELDLLVVGEVFPPLERAPTGLRRDRLVAVPLHLGRLASAHLVDRHVHVPHDVEAIEHVQGGRDLFGDHLEIRLPHVAGHELDASPDLRRECLEASPQALLCPLLGHPQRSFHGVDLVDQREVGMAVAPLHLIDADDLDPQEVTVGQPLLHRMFQGSKHGVPCRVEGIGPSMPREPLGPPRQKPALAGRELLLALSPGHLFDDHAAGRALHPPHRVTEKHRDVPERDKLEPTRRKPVVAGPFLTAFRADRPPIGSGLDLHFDLFRSPGRCDQALPLRDERLERLDVIENTSEVHPAVAPEKGLSQQSHLLPNSAAGCSFFFPWPARQCGASRRRNAAAGRREAAAARIPMLPPGAVPPLPKASATHRQPQADACAMARKPREPGQSPAAKLGLSTHTSC